MASADAPTGDGDRPDDNNTDDDDDTGEEIER
jgi:hypothetical protein